MLGLAIGCAAVAACCYAGAVQLQQRAVRRVSSGTVLRPSGVRAVLRAPNWQLGLALVVLGASLHIFALTQAPLVIVQPIGVLSLVLTVAFAKIKPTPAVLAAMVMSVGGVSAFVALSAHATVATGVPQVGAAQSVALAAAVLAAVGWRTGGRVRCLLLSLATALLFGFASALVRAIGETLHAGGFSPLVAMMAAEAVLSALVGSWLVHQAYASGPAAVVVGATTIIDPLTAVLIDVFAYGEAPHGALPGEVASAAVAVAGLLVLARAVPPPTRPPAARERTGDRLRILIAADTFPPHVNGAAQFAYRLARGLVARGHEVHVVCPSPSGKGSTTVTDGITVHRLGAVRTPFHRSFRVCPPWRAARAVPDLLRRIEPDLVHTQAHFLIGRSAVRAATGRGIPVVATNHFMPENLFGYGPFPQWIRPVLARLAWLDLVRIFGRATVVTAPTPRAVRLLEDNGLAGLAIAVSCGIDRTHFQAAAPVRADHPTVLFVGRLDAEKNVGELLRAAAALPPELDARVDLVGDGTERPRLESQAAELGIADRVTFHGFVSDEELVRAYQRCDVFCMPGTAELQSIATMEAMAAARPVIAADAMALPHLVRPGHNGWLFRPGDIADLTARLAAVLGDPETRAAMGQASLQMIARHDIDNTLDTFERLYLDVTSSTPQPSTPRTEQVPA
jgi:glycosyltransferase involved in cell wall biosynthesis